MLQVAQSSRGAWHLAGTGSLHAALSNGTLRRSGFLLPSDLAGSSGACFNRRMRKTARPVVWEGGGAQSPSLDPIPFWRKKCCSTGVIRTWGAVVLLLVGLSMGASAQTRSQDPLNRESPQSSVYSFLEACHSRNYQRAWRYLNLRRLPEEQRLKGGPQLAQQLEQILDHDVRFDVASLSRDPAGDHEHVDSFTENGRTLDLQL